MTENPRPGKTRGDIERLAMSNTIVRRALDIHFLGHLSYEEALITMVCSLDAQLNAEREQRVRTLQSEPVTMVYERIVPAGCKDPQNENCLCFACREVMAQEAIEEAKRASEP